MAFSLIQPASRILPDGPARETVLSEHRYSQDGRFRKSKGKPSCVWGLMFPEAHLRRCLWRCLPSGLQVWSAGPSDPASGGPKWVIQETYFK